MNYVIRFIVLLGFVLTLPIITISIIAIWLEDGSPTIFFQKRLGINKNEFILYKIRTMKINTPSAGTHEIRTSHHLKIGSLLRKLKIDELPQLINYFKGDIKLVGPRPGLSNQHELTEHREKYEIYSISPGITGLAQILGYDMSQPKLLATIDNLYLKNKSLKLDMQILLATFFNYFKNRIANYYDSDITKLKESIDNY